MITKFDAFYGGHVEMDNLGFQGTPADDRWLSREQLATAYEEAEKFAQLMDRDGFDTLWLAEHHFQREGYGGIPNIPMLGLYLAQVTERLNFGGFFNSVPAWHPLRLAEDYATADILTGGRIRFGIGRGYIAREVETLGAPLEDDSANRELFEEQVEIILKAWTKPSFSHYGKHYTLPARVQYRDREADEITLVPQPLHGPMEVWQPITSATQRGYDFMAKHNIRGVIAGVGEGAERFAVEYQAALARVGIKTQLGEGLAIGFQLHMSDTQEKAIQEAAPFYEEQLKALAPQGRFPKLTEEQIRATFDPVKAPLAGLPTLQDAVKEGSWVCGPPEHVIDKLAELQKRFPGLERVFITAGGLGIPPSVMQADIEWFGKEVMPTFKDAIPGDV